MREHGRLHILLGSIILILVGVYALVVPASVAQEWPTKDITLIVAMRPGGGFDLNARITAPFIAKYLPRRVNVIVKNVPGGNQRMGLREMVTATPDGHTIGVFDPEDIATLQIVGQLEWLDVWKLTWLGRLTALPDMFVVGSHTGFKKPSDMQGKTIRCSGYASGDMFRNYKILRGVGAKPQFIFFEGAGEAGLAIMRGDLDAGVWNWATTMRLVETGGGKVVPMFVNWHERIPGIDVPTAQELGVKMEGVVSGSFKVLVGPPGLPPGVKSKWEETLSKCFADPDWIAQMNKAVQSPNPLMGDKLMDQIRASLSESEKYKDIIREITKMK